MHLKRLINFFLLLVLGFGLSSCEEVIDLNLDETEPWVSFEGWIYTDPGPYQIRITKTIDIYSPDDYPAMTGAQVVISDDAGFSEILTEVSPGIYETNLLQGEIGRTYTLDAVVEGESYSATTKVNRLNPIDTLASFWQEDQGFLEDGYYVAFVAQEAPGIGDYYRFKFYVNDSLYDDAGDLLYTEDRFADGQLGFFQFPYAVEIGDTVMVEALSITAEAYTYYITLQQAVQIAGNPFGSPPDNVEGNISNGAMGFFGGAAVERATVIVQP